MKVVMDGTIQVNWFVLDEMVQIECLIACMNRCIRWYMFMFAWMDGKCYDNLPVIVVTLPLLFGHIHWTVASYYYGRWAKGKERTEAHMVKKQAHASWTKWFSKNCRTGWSSITKNILGIWMTPSRINLSSATNQTSKPCVIQDRLVHERIGPETKQRRRFGSDLLLLRSYVELARCAWHVLQARLGRGYATFMGFEGYMLVWFL